MLRRVEEALAFDAHAFRATRDQHHINEDLPDDRILSHIQKLLAGGSGNIHGQGPTSNQDVSQKEGNYL